MSAVPEPITNPDIKHARVSEGVLFFELIHIYSLT